MHVLGLQTVCHVLKPLNLSNLLSAAFYLSTGIGIQTSAETNPGSRVCFQISMSRKESNM